MAPSASMLFRSYHQLHRPTTQVGAPPQSREEEEAAAPVGGFRMSVRGVLSLALFQRRAEAVPAERKAKAIVHELDVGEEVKAAAAAADLECKFDEALRLSCWSS